MRGIVSPNQERKEGSPREESQPEGGKGAEMGAVERWRSACEVRTGRGEAEEWGSTLARGIRESANQVSRKRRQRPRRRRSSSSIRGKPVGYGRACTSTSGEVV